MTPPTFAKQRVYYRIVLIHLSIRHFALIYEIDLDFDSGMTVLTGETGSGKSILIDALLFALGESKDNPSASGEKSCWVTAHFDINNLLAVKAWLKENGLDRGDQCTVNRTLTEQGRSKGFINGHSVPVKLLRLLGRQLVHIHSQQEQQTLLRTDRQRLLLDEYGGHSSLSWEVNRLYDEWHRLESRIVSSRMAGQQDSNLSSRLEELIQMNFQAEELDQLDQEQYQLANVQKLIQTGQAVLGILEETESANVLEWLNKAKQEAVNLARLDPRTESICIYINHAIIQVDEAQADLKRYLEQIEVNPERLIQIEQRLEYIHRIARKNRIHPHKLPELQLHLQADLEQEREREHLSRKLIEDQNQILENYRKVSNDLSEKRREVARHLQKLVTEKMKQLGLADSQFEVRLIELATDKMTRLGREQVSFYVSTNVGEPLQPLSKVVSGGELARISLIIHLLTAEKASIPTLIFDEVDIGMGGASAEIVGRSLRHLGQSKQVLCITHSPQVAAQTPRHLYINKIKRGPRTQTQVCALTPEEKVMEIARMLGGIEVTPQTLTYARAMLDKLCV